MVAGTKERRRWTRCRWLMNRCEGWSSAGGRVQRGNVSRRLEGTPAGGRRPRHRFMTKPGAATTHSKMAMEIVSAVARYSNSALRLSTKQQWSFEEPNFYAIFPCLLAANDLTVSCDRAGFMAPFFIYCKHLEYHDRASQRTVNHGTTRSVTAAEPLAICINCRSRNQHLA